MKIKTALCGVGYWGSKLKRYIDENPDFELKHVCDSKSDLNEVWDDKEVTAVVIATPNETRFPIVKKALLSNKYVLTEKPLALKTGQCKELVKIGGDRILVDYTYSFSEGLNRAKEIIDGDGDCGSIGELKGIEMSVKHLGRFGGGSVYWLLGSHMLSVLDMFIPLRSLVFKRIDLVANNAEVETGIIEFYNAGLRGQIFVSLNYPGKETRIIFYGTDGTLIYETAKGKPALKEVTYERKRWVIGSKLPTLKINHWFNESDNLQYVVEHFAKLIKGKEKSNVNRAVQITRILCELQS